MSTEAGTVTVMGPRPMGYAEAVALQRRLHERCVEGRGGECLLLVEHPPTITIGRRGCSADVVADDALLRRLGVQVVEADRGGRVTYHGPGQLVAYPIVDLRRRGRDLGRYLRDLEEWLVKVCRSCGLSARGAAPETGVWIEDRKIASVGIAVRRWVSYHGAALNVSTDLSHFGLIVPCGMPQVQMTSMERELGAAPPLAEVARRAALWFGQHFGAHLRHADLEPAEAR